MVGLPPVGAATRRSDEQARRGRDGAAVGAFGDAGAIVSRIEELEAKGIDTAWLPTGGAGFDALTLYAAAAAKTQRIALGTCIIPTWPRHPVTTVQQVQVLASLAPGRLKLGLGPSHKPMIESMFGFDFKKPLTNLREYVHIVKTLLREGAVEFEGHHYRARARIGAPITDVPIMASALRTGSYDFCGEATDGAISWVSPYVFLRDTALPAMREGAKRAGREVPDLVAHAPVCASSDSEAVREAVRKQLNIYPMLPFYAQMFADAGFPEAKALAGWSDGMIDAVVLWGEPRDTGGENTRPGGLRRHQVIAHPDYRRRHRGVVERNYRRAGGRGPLVTRQPAIMRVENRGVA